MASGQWPVAENAAEQVATGIKKTSLAPSPFFSQVNKDAEEREERKAEEPGANKKEKMCMQHERRGTHDTIGFSCASLLAFFFFLCECVCV